jgi:ribosomal protein S12 methylthiotransferase
MKGRVPAKTAQARKQTIEERQIPITEKNMERFTGETLEVLIEEEIAGSKESGTDGENFWLGRLYCQAPEIDGAAVLAESGTGGKIPQVGNLVPCKVIARRGFDLEIRVNL